VLEDPPARSQDVLDTPAAGGKAIRGGVLRIGGYIAGMLLTLASAPLLTRHLGVEDFGHWVTVLSLVTIVALVADAGMTVVGVREYAVRDAEGRRALMANLLALRMLVAGVGMALAVAFAAVAGYGGALVLGTALAGFGMLLGILQVTYTVPLISELKLGVVTAVDLLRQALVVAGIIALVVAGGTLTAFFSLFIPACFIALLVTVMVVRKFAAIRPALDRAEARHLLSETLPAAASTLLTSLFYRVAVIVMSLVATPTQTGYFGASFRIVEVIIAVPSLIAGAAFPIMARAAETNRARLAYAMQRLFEAGVILGCWTAITVILGAQVGIDILGGAEYEPAVPVLRIQGIALAVSFLVAVWAAALWVTGARRALLLSNTVGVAAAIVLTAVLASLHGAVGAAIAMTIAEVVLVVALGTALMRPQADLRVDPAIVLKALPATAAGLSLWFVPIPDVAQVLLGSLVYFGVLLALRALPPDLLDAARGRVHDLAEPAE
jgi:O-antigen/teichoic acid export membrane protein